MLWLRKPENSSGKSVSTSKRIGSRGGRSVLRLRGFGFLRLPRTHELREQHLHLVARLGADAQPVLDAARREVHAVLFGFHVRIVGAELLDNPPVPRLAGVD